MIELQDHNTPFFTPTNTKEADMQQIAYAIQIVNSKGIYNT